MGQSSDAHSATIIASESRIHPRHTHAPRSLCTRLAVLAASQRPVFAPVARTGDSSSGEKWRECLACAVG